MLVLSIIIPVYNVEEYLEKCILSLQDQDIPREHYEIIVINDGSPDNSRDVVIKMMELFPNIVLIDQENKGVSMARNAGIDQAKGKYLLFIDPDDFVLKHSFGKVLTEADAFKAEVAMLGYQYLHDDNSIKASYFFSEYSNKLHTGTEAYYISMKGIEIDPDRSWAILFNREFIDEYKLRFTPHIPYLEDGEFMARVLCLARRCIFEAFPFYIRTVREGSATNSRLFYSERAIEGFFHASNNLKKFKSSHTLNQKQQDQINQPITKFTLLTVQVCIGLANLKKYRMVRKRLKQNKSNKIEMNGVTGIYHKYGSIYNVSYDLFYAAWTMRIFSIALKNKFTNFLGLK